MSFKFQIQAAIVFSHLLAAPVLAETPIIVRTRDLALPATTAAELLAQKAEVVEEELVVTEKKKPKPTSTPVYQVTQEDLKKQGNRNVADTLKNQPGFAVNDTGFAADIHTGTTYRGASINQSVYLLNGRSIGSNVSTYHGNLDLNSIPTSTIDRIELSSGSAATLYGSQALGGVVNIITKPGSQKPELKLGVALGSFGQQNYRASYTGSGKGFDYAIGFEQSRADNNYDVPVGAANRGPDGKLFNADTASNSYYARISAALDPRNTLSFDATKITSQKGLIYFGFPLQKDRLDHDAYNIGLNLRSEFSKDSILNTTIGYNRDYFNTYGPTGATFYRQGDLDSQAITLRVDHDWQLTKAFKLRWGTDLKNESLISNALSTNPTVIVNNARIDQSRFISALFAVGTIDLASNLQAELGLRQNFSSDRLGSSLNPSLGLNWAPTKTVNIRGSWVSVRRLPGLDQLYAYDTVHGWFPNANLNAESGSAWTVGVDFKPNDKFTGQLTYFGNSLSDRIATQSRTVNGRTITQWQNIGQVSTNGLELALKYQFTPAWRSFLNYTYIDARIGTGVDTGLQLAAIPFSVAQFGVGYDRMGWQVNLSANYYSGSRRSVFASSASLTREFSPSWLNIDLNARVPITPQIGITAYLQNLFGGTYEKTNRLYEPGTTFRVALDASF
jgi:vitamin B12 transporter